MKSARSFLLASLILVLFSCQPLPQPGPSGELEPSLPDIPHQYSNIQFPEHFGREGEHASNPLRHRVTDMGAQLGRVLFYDKRLSINNTISCASCHNQALGFADPSASSVGFRGAITPRNSMTIVNPILQHNFFWDSRVHDLRMLVLEPVQNHIEMGMESEEQVIQKLSETSFYPALFGEVYGSPEITVGRVRTAMTEFLLSMVSYDSKFDKGAASDFANFSPIELAGKELFFSPKTQCSSCHAGGNFDAPDAPFEPYGFREGSDLNPAGTANIGLDVHYADNGRFDGRFKIPSLRNIALTAPYMHDGRFQTLEEVVRHYSENIQPHEELDPKFRDDLGQVQKLNLNEAEIQSLVAFLHTLTDVDFINDPKFSDPFLN